MASIAALLASSTKLQNSAHRYEEQYDRQIRDLVASLHRSSSSNALNFAANDPTILDVGSALSMKPTCGNIQLTIHFVF